jgi:hypothetical protein
MRHRRSTFRLKRRVTRGLRRIGRTLQLVDQLECEFEDQTVVQLLTLWGLSYRRQVVCEIRKRGQVYLGRIDFLVHTEDNATLLTLFENKRRIRSEAERTRAVRQADTYARARRLRSFVIAAPEGLWIYSRPGGRPLLVASFLASDIRAGAPQAKALLIELSRRQRKTQMALGPGQH